MSSTQRVVWFNDGLENLYDIFAALRQADTHHQLRLIASDASGHPWCAALADEVFREPAKSANEAYVQWALRICAEKKVELFVPMRSRHQIAAAADRFAAIGVQVLSACDAKTMNWMSSKARVYTRLADEGVAIPEWYQATTVSEFDRAYHALRSRGHVVCVKPAQGVFGRGFHIVREESRGRYAEMFGRSKPGTTRQQLRTSLGAKEPFDMLVMQYLEGPERSVDCVAQNGELLAAVSRVKRSRYQEIEPMDAPSVEYARIITRTFGMDGVFNVQTRDHEGVSYLLEVNTRPSGGIGQAIASGVNLAWYAIAPRLGLVDLPRMPEPNVGLRVVIVPHAVVVGHRNNPIDAAEELALGKDIDVAEAGEESDA
jgi:biotin carboxylase